jgi:hypothetical protein
MQTPNAYPRAKPNKRGATVGIVKATAPLGLLALTACGPAAAAQHGPGHIVRPVAEAYRPEYRYRYH